VRFWVRDHGPGIAAEDQARLFIPFTQLNHGLGDGHGLGLSIVRRIADKLDGQAGVESAPGRGSLFYFTLPAAPDSDLVTQSLAEAKGG
jgi:signal transduction histidine kinase